MKTRKTRIPRANQFPPRRPLTPQEQADARLFSEERCFVCLEEASIPLTRLEWRLSKSHRYLFHKRCLPFDTQTVMAKPLRDLLPLLRAMRPTEATR